MHIHTMLRPLHATALAALVAFVAPALPGSVAAAGDKVMTYAPDDPDMNAAILKARNRLSLFWQHFAAPGPGEESFAIKVRVSDGTNAEHFWCIDIEGGATGATCTIDNEPALVFTVRSGDRIDVKPEDITDWIWRRDGRLVGGETIRVMLPTLPEDQADALRAMLAEE